MKVPFVDLTEQHREIRDEIDSAIREIIDQSCFVGGASRREF